MSRSLLRTPVPSAWAYLTWQNVLSSAITAVAGSFVVVISRILFAINNDGLRKLDRSGSITDLATQSAILTLVLFVVIFLGRWFWHSRRVQDGAFQWIGFVATFSGLGILLLFLLDLSINVGHYFHYTPELIAENNKKLQRDVDDLPEAHRVKMAALEKELQQELAKIDNGEQKARLEKRYREQIFPAAEKDLEQQTLYRKKLLESGVRTDMSTGSLLWNFLTGMGSTGNAPQDAGILPALVGSLWLGLVTILVAVPVGVGAALYLEEYKTDNRLSRLIQVNINNLAGVPSVVYGILGAFIFVPVFRWLHSMFGWVDPRSLLGGGLTLGLLTMPVVIVASQEAIRAVPKSIRQGAYALGATRWQTIWRLVLPMAFPGILTGTILSISRAMGEAAPLVLFGAYQSSPGLPDFFSSFTLLPMQVFSWADRPGIYVAAEDKFLPMWEYNASFAIVVLLVMILSMNAVAIYLRNRSQKTMRY